ncbi:MAG: M48 family metallopeptidase [Pseudomonadales bacterium]
MNFFESQDRAQRKTTQLIVLFSLAVISLVVLTNVLVVLVAVFTTQGSLAGADWRAALGSIGWEMQAFISIGVVLVIAGASLFKVAALSGGGAAVAESLGGKLINSNTTDLSERRVLNVVEEMAIAAGLPVPPVYIMDENSVNAFAAGFQPQDAVIGLTRGTMQLLSREELQGVIGHEFSHVLHGDMRINIRLMGALYGIMVIGMVGYFIMRTFAHSNVRRSSNSNNQGALPFLVLGVGLMIIGYAGTFFGNVIKASVSRQREFLADASAVQYTRNPEGIAGALKKIGAATQGSKILHPHAAEVSHMFFGQAVRVAFNTFLATHPPLSKRIKLIEPNWDGKFPELGPAYSAAHANALAAEEQVAGFAGASVAAAESASLIDSIGQLDEKHIDYSRNLIDSIADRVIEAAREPDGAKAVVYALLFASEPALREKQLDQVEQAADAQTYQQLISLLPDIEQLGVEYRLPLIDLCIPVLKTLYHDQYREFRLLVLALMRADEQIDLFEWCLHRLLVRHLDPVYSRVRPPKIRYDNIEKLEKHCAVLLAALAYAGADSETQAQQAFAQGMAELDFASASLPGKRKAALREVDEALAKLNSLTPLQKPRLIKACAQCVAADEKILPQEVELVRAVADSLDVPLPPLMAGQKIF